MLKNYSYNVEYRKLKKPTKYAEEIKLLHEFITSENDNLCLEYHDSKEAHNAANMLYRYNKQAHKHLIFKQRGNFVITERKVSE